MARLSSERNSLIFAKDRLSQRLREKTEEIVRIRQREAENHQYHCCEQSMPAKGQGPEMALKVTRNGLKHLQRRQGLRVLSCSWAAWRQWVDGEVCRWDRLKDFNMRVCQSHGRAAVLRALKQWMELAGDARRLVSIGRLLLRRAGIRQLRGECVQLWFDSWVAVSQLEGVEARCQSLRHEPEHSLCHEHRWVSWLEEDDEESDDIRGDKDGAVDERSPQASSCGMGGEGAGNNVQMGPERWSDASVEVNVVVETSVEGEMVVGINVEVGGGRESSMEGKEAMRSGEDRKRRDGSLGSEDAQLLKEKLRELQMEKMQELQESKIQCRYLEIECQSLRDELRRSREEQQRSRCVRACLRACVRACVRVCVSTYVCVFQCLFCSVAHTDLT